MAAVSRLYFIDEAAQALEAACWIAIRKADRGGSRREIIASFRLP